MFCKHSLQSASALTNQSSEAKLDATLRTAKLVGTKEDIADRFAIYGPEFLDKCQRAAAYVDRILGGEKLVRSAIRPKRCSLNDRKSFVPLQLRVRRSMIGGNLHPRTAKIRMADRLLP